MFVLAIREWEAKELMSVVGRLLIPEITVLFSVILNRTSFLVALLEWARAL
jgi:hypothetical protein